MLYTLFSENTVEAEQLELRIAMCGFGVWVAGVALWVASPGYAELWLGFRVWRCFQNACVVNASGGWFWDSESWLECRARGLRLRFWILGSLVWRLHFRA